MIRPARTISGSLEVPGDKSISHRYAMLAALAEGTSEISHFSAAADCRSTLACLERLGVKVDAKGDPGRITGVGPAALGKPPAPRAARNSGAPMPPPTALPAG